MNEIAQSEAFLADGLPWVRYWLHNEFLQLGGAKMAKSAGGAPRLADLTEAGYRPSLAPPLAGTGQRNERGSWMSRLREMERRMSSLILPSR